MSNLQPNCCLEFDFQKVDQHAGGKWLIHDTKHQTNTVFLRVLWYIKEAHKLFFIITSVCKTMYLVMNFPYNYIQLWRIIINKWEWHPRMAPAGH